MLNKGYALIWHITTPTTSARSIDRALERLQMPLKMTSAGDLSIFLHDNFIRGHHFSKDSWTPNTFQPVKVRFTPIKCMRLINNSL